MSTSIDQRVVQMRFDNTDFEKNANATIGVLEKLKQKLTFKDSSKAFDELQAKSNSINFNSLEQSANNVGSVLETKIIAKLAIVQNLVNRITDAGANMVKSLTIDQVSSGWNKYESKLASTQTIMNATGKSADEVSKYLQKLMWYTDETSYSFTDMVRNVGLFTAANVGIDDAIPSIIGIANAAGLAGANVENASHAMNGFSKAMGQGYMSTNTWEWLKTAQVATAETKKQMIETAEAMGTLKKVGDGLWQTLAGNEVTIGDFTSALKDKWLTSDVMVAALRKFGDYSEAVYELYQNGMSTADAMDALSGKFAEVGEKGMRASQESKTFADAINAIKDAVSSGWMQTFEILFGGFEEAKEVWAGLYEELYDLFGASSEVRNDILKQWSNIGGRTVLFKTIAKGWQKVKAILDIVRKAFEEVFPPVTVTNLLNFTNNLHTFITSLQLSEDAAYSLKVVLKTLLLPLKLLTIGVKAGVLGLKIFITAANRVSNVLLTMMANTEYTQKVFQNIFGEEQGTRIFNALSTIFTNIGNAISNMIEKFKNLKETLSSDEDFLSFIDGAKKAISDFVKNGIDLLATGLESLANGDWKPFFNMISDGFKNLPGFAGKAAEAIQKFISTFMKFSGIKLPDFSFSEFLKSIKELVDKLNPFKEGIDDTSEKGEKLKETITNITKAIMEFISKINPAKILVFGFGVALIGLIISISKLVTAAADVTSSFNGIGKSFKGVLDAIKTRIDPTIKKTKTFGDTCIKIAASVLILVGAMMALSKVPAEDLKKVTITIVELMAAITGAVVLISLFNGVGARLGATENSVNSLAKIILSFAVSMAAFGIAVKLMDDVNISWTTIAQFVTMLVALTVAVAALAQQSGSFQKGALAIAAMGVAMMLIVKAINMLDPETAMPAVGAMSILMGMMTLMLLAVKGASEHAGKAASGSIKIAVAIGLMGVVIKMMGDMASSHGEVMMIGFIVAATELFGLMLPMFIISKLLGEHAKDSANAFKQMATAIALLTIPIFLLGSMNIEVLKQGGIAVAALLGIFGLLTLFAKVVKKDEMVSFAKGMLEMASAITLLTIPIAVLGSLDRDTLIKGSVAVGMLLIILGAFSALQKAGEKAKTSLVPVIAAIGLFTASIMLLTLLPMDEVLMSAAILSVAVLALGGAMRLMSSMDWKSGIGVLVSVIGFIAMLATGILLINNLGDTEAVLVKVGSLGAVLLALAGAVWIISESKGVNWKNAVQTIGVIGAFVVSAGVVVLALGNFGGNDMARVLLNAAALSGVLIAIAGAAKIMSGTEGVKFGDPKQAVENILGLIAFIGTAALAVGLLGKLGGDNIEQVLSNAFALSLVLVATAGAASVLTDSSSNKWDKELEKKAEAMVAFIVVASIAVGLLGNFGGSDPAQVISNAFALGIVVDLMAVAVKIMGSTDFKSGFGQAIVMGFMVLAAAGALLMLRDVPTEGLLEKTLAIIGILAAVTAISVILGKIKIDTGSVIAGMKGLGIVFGLIAAVFIVIGFIGEVLDANGVSLESILDRAASIFGKIGSVIGAFFGGIVAGYQDASTENAEEIGDRLASFINKFSGTIENVNQFDESMLDKFDNFSTAVETMITMSNKVGAITGDNLVSFGTKLNEFAEPFGTFCESIKGYGTDDVTAAVAAADTMAGIAERLTPGLFENTPSLGEFGSELEAIAPHIASFAKTISDAEINPSTVEASVNAAGTIAEFANQLSGNTVYASMSTYSGNTVLSDFGAELASFGPKIAGYARAVSDVTNWDPVTNSSKAAETIAAFANKLPSKEGIAQTILGEKMALSSFADELDSFAPAFVSYALKMGEVTDWSIVTNSSKAAETVAEFANKLPSMGGWFQDWFGSKSLFDFGVQLNMFGSRFKLYSDSVKNLDIDAIQNSADAANYVIDLYSKMPTTGGWLEAITGGTMDLSTFAQGMKDFGSALSEYNAYVENLSFGKITASTTAAGLIVDLSDRLGDFKKNNVTNFKNAMKEFADLGTDAFLQKFTDASTKFVEAGQKVIGNLITGLESRKSGLTDAGADVVTACLNGILSQARSGKAVSAGKGLGEAIASGVRDESKFKYLGITIIDYISDGMASRKSYASEQLKSLISGLLTTVNEINKNNDAYSNTYKEFGIKMIEGLIQGWNNKKKAIDDNLKKIISGITDAFKKKDKDFVNIGVNIIKGIQKGMAQQKGYLFSSSGTIAGGIITAMMKALGIHSPSREAEEKIGNNVIYGIANGLENNNAANKAAEKKADTILGAFVTAMDDYESPNLLDHVAKSITEDKSPEIAAKAKANSIRDILNSSLSESDAKLYSIRDAIASFGNGSGSIGDYRYFSISMEGAVKSMLSEFERNMYFAPVYGNSDSIRDQYLEIEKVVSGSIKTIDDFKTSLKDLYAIDSFHLDVQTEAQRKIEVLGELMQHQNEAVSKAENNYLNAVRQYGMNSAEATKELSNWTKEKLQAIQYENDLFEARRITEAPKRMRELNEAIAKENDIIEREQKRYERNMAKVTEAEALEEFRKENLTNVKWTAEALELYWNTMEEASKAQSEADDALRNIAEAESRQMDHEKELADMRSVLGDQMQVQAVKYASQFLDIIGNSVEDLRGIENDEAQNMVEFIDNLQENVANGIITNPAILDAIRDKFGDVLDLFSDMTADIDRQFETQSKEYQLWELTVGADATDEEKNAKKLEIMEKEIAAAANKVKVAARKEQEAAMMYGEGSVEYAEAHNEFLDAQIEHAQLIDEYYETQFNIENEAEKAAKQAQKTAKEQEEAAKKGKTALQKAQEEFEEWKKDGSLQEWYSYGATDEELMAALLKKYKDDEDTTKKIEKIEEEEEKTYQRSGKAIMAMMNSTFSAANYDVDKAYEVGMEGLVAMWAKDWESNADSAYEAGKNAGESYATGYSDGLSGISSTTAAAVEDEVKERERLDKIKPENIRAYAELRNLQTGEMLKGNFTREQFFLKATQGGVWEVTLAPDWDKAAAEYWGENIQMMNTHGTLEDLKDPIKQYDYQKNYETNQKLHDAAMQLLAWLEKNGIDWQTFDFDAHQSDPNMPTDFFNLFYTTDDRFDKTSGIQKGGQRSTFNKELFTESLINRAEERLLSDVVAGGYDGKANFNGTELNSQGWIVMQRPDGAWVLVDKSQFQKYIDNGYSYFEDQYGAYVPPSTGGIQSTPITGQEADEKYWQTVQEEVERRNKELEESLEGITKDSVSSAVSSGVTNGYVEGLQSGVSNINNMDPGSVVQDALNNLNTDNIIDEVMSQYVPDPNSWASWLDNAGQGATGILDNVWQTISENGQGALDWITGSGLENIGNIASDAAENAGESVSNFLNNLMGSIASPERFLNANSAGVNTVVAFADGIQNEGETKIPESSQAIVDILDEQVPLYYGAGNVLGSSTVLGMIAGVDSKAPLLQGRVASLTASLSLLGGRMTNITNATAAGATASVRTVNNAAKNASNTSAQFTIIPVVDLDSAKEGFKALDNMKSAQEASAISLTIENRQKESNAIANQSQTKTTPTVINYTQNNNSPKALSRYDIYRDTKNQLSMLKGGTSVT